jgi:hypothetical protein
VEEAGLRLGSDGPNRKEEAGSLSFELLRTLLTYLTCLLTDLRKSPEPTPRRSSAASTAKSSTLGVKG